VSFQPEGTGTNIRAALEYFHHVNKKRSIAFLISDFIDDGYDRTLRIISRKHDVIAVELADLREQEMSDVGLVKFRDAESGAERWIDTGHAEIRRAFNLFWRTRAAARKELFVRSKVDSIMIRIDRPYIKPIVDFFRLRERRL